MMVSEALNGWLATGDRGISSEAIVTKLTGINILGRWPWPTHPRDPSDFARCMGLLGAVPEFRPRLKEMSEVSPVWAALIEHWAELEELYRLEVLSGKAPKLYDRMHELGA